MTTATGTERPPLTVLITGATDGLGRALAVHLAGTGATVLVHGRSDERGRDTVDEIRARTGNDRVRFHRADLAELTRVADLADRVGRDHDHLDVLVNNAGIGTTVPGGGRRQESADGHELRFAVNYLAGYALTHRLLPLLRAAPAARIVHVSSAGQAPIDFTDVMLTRSYSGVQAYCQSKLAQIMFTFDLGAALAARLDAPHVTATALHPATYMPTKIVDSPVSTLEEGVDATARLAIDPTLAGVTGRYFNGRRDARANAQAYDADARRRLAELSGDLTGLP